MARAVELALERWAAVGPCPAEDLASSAALPVRLRRPHAGSAAWLWPGRDRLPRSAHRACAQRSVHFAIARLAGGGIGALFAISTRISGERAIHVAERRPVSG